MSRRRRRKPLPSGDFSATITGLSHEGRGVTQIEGKTTFIRGALPGETVQFQYTQVHGSYDVGRVVSVENASSDRATPDCAHFDMCGGCSLQHIKPAIQISIKEDMLLEQLRQFGQVEPENVLPPLTGPLLGYRRKARLGVRHDRKKGLLVGFRESDNPRFITNIDTCVVLHPSIGENIANFKQLVSELSVHDEIPQIEVAVSDDVSSLIIRHMEDLSDDDITHIQTFAEEHGFRIYTQRRGPKTLKKCWPLDDNDFLNYTLPEFNLTLDFHTTDFTQVNSDINRQMVSHAVKLLDIQADDEILDLFCGLGNFSLPIARFAKRVVGVEGDDNMVKRATHNARINQIENTEFYAANLMEDCSEHPWAKQTFNKLLIDPPRSGAQEIIPTLMQNPPEKIVYVSCNPATLARDAGILVNTYGYKLQAAGVMDMFPHTAHVESIAVFIK